MNILKQIYFQQPRGSAHKKAFAESKPGARTSVIVL